MRRVLLCLGVLALYCGAAAALPRIAVMNLENKSGYRGTEYDLGGGMADMLVTSFVNTKQLKVVERAEIEKVLNEQKIGMSGAITAETAAQVGKILGVEYMVIGSINEFGTQSSSLGAFGVGVVNHTANVGLDIRVIDTTSAEITAAATGQCNKSTRGVGISNSAIFPTKVGFGSADFSTSLIGKATRGAVDDAVKKVMKTIGGSWKGVVIKVSEDGTVMINGGENVGLQSGDAFAVMRKGEDLIDPQTGESLGSDDTMIGEIRIIEVKPKYAVCKVISGKGFAAKDRVEKK